MEKTLQEQIDEIFKDSIIECSDLSGDCSKCLQNMGIFCIKQAQNTNIYAKPLYTVNLSEWNK